MKLIDFLSETTYKKDGHAQFTTKSLKKSGFKP